MTDLIIHVEGGEIIGYGGEDAELLVWRCWPVEALVTAHDDGWPKDTEIMHAHVDRCHHCALALMHALFKRHPLWYRCMRNAQFFYLKRYVKVRRFLGIAHRDWSV
jgi:hypothetical protein